MIILLICLSLLMSGCATQQNSIMKETQIEIPKQYKNDKDLIIAIKKAAEYAFLVDDSQLAPFSVYSICLTVEYCNNTWDGKRDFVEYVLSELKKQRVNCDGWYKYFEVFYGKQ